MGEAVWGFGGRCGVRELGVGSCDALLREGRGVVQMPSAMTCTSFHARAYLIRRSGTFTGFPGSYPPWTQRLFGIHHDYTAVCT